ncbi:MAG: M50 family metallopeptidase [Candidatus Altiarchaeota archaeon]
MSFIGLATIAFVLGTLALIRLDVKRYFIIFLIKTQRGIRLLEMIAGLSPRFWKFMGNAAIVVSFGGLGAAYLSKHRKRRSLYVIEFFIALIIMALVLAEHGLAYASVAGVALLAAIISFYKAGSRGIDFLSCTAMIYLIGVTVVSFGGVATNAGKLILLAGSVFGLPAVVLVGLATNASSILAQESNVPGVSPLMPSERAGEVGVSFPGYDIFIPWWHALIALIITVVAHEFSHGVMAKAHKMKIKSTGIITVGILPIGAFVEPDEEEVKGRSSVEKMRLYSAGSFANLCVCALAGAVYVSMIFLIAFSIKTDGLQIIDTAEGYPAYGVLEKGSVIYAVNDAKPNLENLIPDVKPGEKVALTTDKGVVELTAVPSPVNESRGYIGVYMMQHYVLKEGVGGMMPFAAGNEGFVESYIKAILFLLTSMKWIMFFNFNIALVNLIPLAPFDGWHMLKELLSVFNVGEQSAQRISYGVLAFTVLLFLINISPLGSKVISAVI